jgi:hypothetical protein
MTTELPIVADEVHPASRVLRAELRRVATHTHTGSWDRELRASKVYVQNVSGEP